MPCPRPRRWPRGWAWVPSARCQHSAAQPSLIPGGEKCDTFNGTLKFHGDDAYLMALNKAFLKAAQTAPQGRVQAAGEPPCPRQPKCSLICLRGTTWHSKLLLEPSAGPFMINININNINIMRMSEGLRGQGCNAGCLVPFQAAPSLRDRCGRPASHPPHFSLHLLTPPLVSGATAEGGRSAGGILRRGAQGRPPGSFACDGSQSLTLRSASENQRSRILRFTASWKGCCGPSCI